MSSKISIFSVKNFCFSLILVVFALFPAKSFAYEPVEEAVMQAEAVVADTAKADTHEESGKFNAGEMIIEHIGDSHQWHLWGDHGHGVHIPLPVILWTDKGLEIFSSSNVEHSEDIYQGTHYKYMLRHEHIEIVDDFGNVDKDATAKVKDFSITKNALTIIVSALLMLWMFLSVARAYKRREGMAPKGLQSFMEPLILFIRDDVAKTSIGEKKYMRYMPYLLTVFFFIFINNLMGLIPIFPFGSNLTGNISVCLVLAAITLIITLISGNGHYWRHIFAMPGVPIPVLIILTPIELLGIVLRPFVLMIRLFANITAGHIIALAFFSLIFIFGEKSTGAGYGVSIVSVLFTVFMGFLELLVAFLQAYVFTLLSAIYIGAAVEEGHHEHDHHVEKGHEPTHVIV
ncbi:MAG: synthase subcomplex subunit [Bacteroidetes bacterium]|jgi:F-type H+-transporting ATPase subunit a|nr:synthase subcomplex subunit [Bacteroidota bacterium]